MEIANNEKEEKLEEARKLVLEEKRTREEACTKEISATLEKYGCGLELISMIRAKNL